MNVFQKIKEHWNKPFEGVPLHIRLLKDERGILPALAFLANPAFWAGAGNAAGAAGGIMSMFGLGKKKPSGSETVAPETLLPKFQVQTGEELAGFVSKYLSQYQPGKDFGGDFTAPMTGTETTGINRLNQFLSAPDFGELFDATKQNVLDTVGGKYADPNTSPFIRSMINLSKMNLQDSIDTSRRGAGSRGSYFTEGAIKDENRLREKSGATLDTIIGDFINQERGRQLQASPLAMALEQYQNVDVPLKKVEASQTYGALPRLIQQAQLESEYSDFKRQQEELGKVPGTAGTLFSRSTPYIPGYTTPNTEQPNAMANILQMIGKLNLGALGGGGSIWEKLSGVLKPVGVNPGY